MAKLKSGTELAVANQLSGDASTLVDKIVVAGSKRVVFYRTTCTQSEYEQGIEFESGDAMSYIEDAGDVTISKDVTEKDMYMLTTKAKIPGSAKIQGFSYTASDLCHFDQKRGGFTTSKTAARPGCCPE